MAGVGQRTAQPDDDRLDHWRAAPLQLAQAWAGKDCAYNLYTCLLGKQHAVARLHFNSTPIRIHCEHFLQTIVT
jgi:hypothetical protein